MKAIQVSPYLFLFSFLCVIISCEPTTQGNQEVLGKNTCLNHKHCLHNDTFCVPDDNGDFTCQPLPKRNDGAPCDDNRLCLSGTCLQGPDWKEGYCTTTNCQTASNCHGNKKQLACIHDVHGSRCLQKCDDGNQCRDGYDCKALLKQTDRFCLKEEKEVIPEAISVDPFDAQIICEKANGQAPVTIEYTIPTNTTSYQLTAWIKDPDKNTTLDIYKLDPIRLELPDGTDILLQDVLKDSNHPYFSFIMGSYLIHKHSNFLIPNAPQWQKHVIPGLNKFTFKPYSTQLTTKHEICIKVIPEISGTKRRLDFNIYLVGVKGLNANKAPTNKTLKKVIEGVKEIFERQNFEINQIKYYNVLPEIEQQYSILDISNKPATKVHELVSYSKYYGLSPEDNLVVNLFLVSEFKGDSIAGISSGLPGLAGFSGTPGTGVVFTTEFLNRKLYSSKLKSEYDGTAFTSIIMAHEIGHFLGLFHTTETTLGMTDPLSDTPSCQEVQIQGDDAINCPDINNLMFPYGHPSHQIITDDQASVIQANILTK